MPRITHFDAKSKQINGYMYKALEDIRDIINGGIQAQHMALLITIGTVEILQIYQLFGTTHIIHV